MLSVRRVLPDIREWPKRLALVLSDEHAASCLAQHQRDWENFQELAKQSCLVAKVIRGVKWRAANGGISRS